MNTETINYRYNLEQLQRAYNTDQQVKYMSLEAELELLLQQIKTKKNS